MTSQQGQELPRPFKPRPRLFRILLMAFIFWMAALLILYFTTVWPLHHPSSQAVQTAPSTD